MAELIEGLNDATAAEYARLREELRAALAKSDYTLEQAASFAGVSVGTVRNALSGANAIGIDKLIRLLFVLGGRIEIVRPQGAGKRPFQVVENESWSSLGKASSTSSSESVTSLPERRVRKANIAAKTPNRSNKKAANLRGSTPKRNKKTNGYNAPPFDLRKHTAGTLLRAS